MDAATPKLEPLYSVAPPGAGHVATGAGALASALAPAEAGADVDLVPLAGEPAAVQLTAALTAIARAPTTATTRVRVPVSGHAPLGDIAKLRALRRLAARVGELAGTDVALDVEAVVTAEASADAPSDLIRNTVAVFAAVTGGADRVRPHAFDDAHARLADNVVRLALHEAHLGAVQDPAAGSFALETLTEALCADAWARAGGAA